MAPRCGRRDHLHRRTFVKLCPAGTAADSGLTRLNVGRLTVARLARRMRTVTHISPWVRCAVSVILLAIAWVDGAGLEFQARAMACCSHRQDCGGNLRAPDTCCERMGHGVPAKTGTIVQTSHAVAPVTTAFVAPAPTVAQAPAPHFLDFIRPHDPPHLHTFTLLI